MVIKKLTIENWKSIVHLELNNPNPFSVFVGPNASGKSNIFEALDFFNLNSKMAYHFAERKFGGLDSFKPYNYSAENIKIKFDCTLNEFNPVIEIHYKKINAGYEFLMMARRNFPVFSDSAFDFQLFSEKYPETPQLFEKFSRIFIGNTELDRSNFNDDFRLSTDAGNLEKVLKRILKDESKREEIIEWLQLLIPGFENIEIQSQELSGTDSLLIYEKGTQKPFPKNLISDGTYNILALLTAVFQSDEPQFLLIEEPENGLNPKVVKELVNLFRYRCEEHGDFIWLNTHSQTLIRQLQEEEIILVDKKEGETFVTQLKKGDASGMPLDEALLTNTFGGGIPW
ncbi:MAG: AAA family ATPase [Chitinophagales bacterium]